MIDDLKAMAIFAETVKRGSFRAAAKALNLSPSVVSYQITKLEERLGTALIYRSTRKLSKTAEGETLYTHALQMIDQAEQGIRNVSGHDVATGKITITLPGSLSRDILTRQLVDFSKQNPGIHMQCSYSDERYDLISEGIDIAFRMGSMPDSSLNAKKISDKERVLACSPSYYAKHPEPKSPEDLKNWNWLRHDLLPNHRALSKKGHPTFQVEIQGNVSANSAEAMVEFAILGLGISTLSRWLIEDELNDGRLIRVLPDWEAEPIPLYAVWHGNITDCSNTRRLLNFLQEY